MRRRLALPLAVAATLVLGACQVGQRALRRDYPAYNQTVREIEDEHMLLNLVRLRYLETPVFLQISSISTTYGVSANASLAGTVASGGGDSATGSLGSSISETPTITYSLPESREFFGRMLAPLSATQLALIGMGGAGGFFRMGVRKINGLENVATYTGWETQVPDTFAEFEEAMQLTVELESEGLIDYALAIAAIEASSPIESVNNTRAIPEGEAIGIEFWRNEDGELVAYYGKKVPHLRFSRASDQSPKARRLRELLGLDPGRYTFPIVDSDFSQTEKDRIGGGAPAAALDSDAVWEQVALNNRSMMEVLLYASKSVQVPVPHLEAGLAEPTEPALGGLLTIHTSPTPPDDAAIAVEHHGHWFYIAPNDLSSKMTFARLNILFAVTAGTVPGSQPVLTLPVG
jgi:hypothetical protein